MSLTLRLLTAREVAGLLGISLRTLVRWRQRRFGPPQIIIGGNVRYRLETLIAWLEEHERHAAVLRAKESKDA